MNKFSRWGCCALIMALAVPIATADLSENIFELVICHNGVCVGELHVPSLNTWNPDLQQWEWSNASDVQFDVPGTGEVAAVMGAGSGIVIQPPIPGQRADPQVNLNFVMTAGSEDTEFTISSSLYTFGPLVNPVGQAEVGINLSDRNGDDARLWSVAPANGVSLSHYNGLVPGGSLFAELLSDDIVVSVPWHSASGQDDTGGLQPISGIVTSMSAQIHFMVSAQDLASGSSTFVIIPEPASILLLATLVLFRRR